MNGAETQLPLSKRLLAALFALVLVVGMAPVSAWAEGEDNAQDSANAEQTDNELNNESSTDVTGGGESSDNADQDSTEPGDEAGEEVSLANEAGENGIAVASLNGNINPVDDTATYEFEGSIGKKTLYQFLNSKWGASLKLYTYRVGGVEIKSSATDQDKFVPNNTGTSEYTVEHSIAGLIWIKDGTLKLVEMPKVTIANEYTYDGNSHKPVLTNYENEVLTEGVDYDATYTRNGQETTDTTSVGTINVAITAKNGYANPDPSSYSYTINSADTMTVSCEGYTGTYDGKEHTPTATATVPDGSNATIEYSLDNTNWVSDAPSIKDAGEKTVYVRATNSNYVTAESSYTLKVAKAKVTVSVEGNSNTVTYSGSEQKAEGYKATGITGEATDKYSLDSDFELKTEGSDVAKGTNVDTYAMGLTSDSFVNKNDNYEVEFNVTDGKLTIDPAEVTVSVAGKTGSLVYNGQEQSLEGFEVIGVDGDAMDCFDFDSVLLADSCFAKAKGTDADTYKMGLTEGSFYCADENFKVVKYEVTDGSLTINKRVIEASNSASVVYNGQEQVLNITEANATGLVDGDELYLKNAQVKGTEPGTYTDVTEYSWTVISGNLIVNNNYDLKVTGELTITKADSGSGSGSATDNGNTGKADKTDKAKASSASPQTGDSIAPFAMAAGIIAIAAALAAFFMSRKLRGTTRR